MKTQKKAIGASESGWSILSPVFLFKAKLKPIKGLSGQIGNGGRNGFGIFAPKGRVYA